jgi:hypothetical protein
MIIDDIVPSQLCNMLICYMDVTKQEDINEGLGHFKRVFLYDKVIMEEVISCIKKGYAAYRRKFDTPPLYEMEVPSVTRYDPPVDKINIHSDNFDFDSALRQLGFTIYLNDVAEGGKTVFIENGLSVQPRKGRMIIFPPFWTHRHYGEPPISGSKYILTTWLSYHRKEFFTTVSI